MRAVVLGGTGFLGRHIHGAFQDAGARVVPVSRSDATHTDLTEDSGLRRLAELLARVRPHVVVNAAGRAWQADERQMAEGNAELVDRLVGVLAAQDHRPRLIHLGSVHEYGPGHVGTSTAEEHPAAPSTPYGRTKLLGTRFVLRAVAAGEADGVVLRLANVSGPGTPRGSLLRQVADHLVEAARAQDRGEIPEALRFRTLAVRRDFVDARDVADAVLAAAAAPLSSVNGQIVNIGRGEAVLMRHLVARMVALSGLPVEVVEDADGRSPREDAQWQRLDVSKARRVLGWHPHRDLDRSLRDLLDTACVPVRGEEREEAQT
ncbi:NAD-dependent epimerase/dehydratase family protein [Streptomyces sp. NPDC056690]|uniref:NAD-dependent epimerase/dehydratase family protein n=1 Tax=unclassified Streptomyces TaxID=2593676 RepID=UPI00362C234D